MCSEEPNVNEDIRPDLVTHCGAAKELLDQFGEAVRAAGELHREQFQAIVEGDENSIRFDVLIHEASEQKQNSKYAYLAHLDCHGCSTTDNDAIDARGT
jgi:hypothetical protein